MSAVGLCQDSTPARRLHPGKAPIKWGRNRDGMRMKAVERAPLICQHKAGLPQNACLAPGAIGATPRGQLTASMFSVLTDRCSDTPQAPNSCSPNVEPSPSPAHINT
ncbi:hypothetical protein E5D57_012057 [Metarhizium anisopliae]|nr:hypothetical protein E5D57_012057 [Metarhizium anisopliae]